MMRARGEFLVGLNKQRSYAFKQKPSSPASTFGTAAVDSEYHRYVAVVDIPNSFVQTDLTKNGEAEKKY